MAQSSEEELFYKAADRIRKNTKLKLTNGQKLELYGYYKQATEGKCHSTKPTSFFDFTNKAKWEAWNRLDDMDQNTSMNLYIELVSKIDPDWETNQLVDVGTDTDESCSSSNGVGPVVSTLIEKQETIPDNQKTIFDWCREGDLDRIKDCLKHNDINQIDEQGIAPIHWACDRGNIRVLQCLIDNGANVDLQDSEGLTPLHYAAICSHDDVIDILLANGADKNKTDKNGEIPLDTCDSTLKHKLM